MAEFTPNYNLKKPGQDDFYNIEDFNENADIIDAELKKLNDAIKNLDVDSITLPDGKTISEKFEEITEEVGNIQELNTDEKANIVASINEIYQALLTHQQNTNQEIGQVASDLAAHKADYTQHPYYAGNTSSKGTGILVITLPIIYPNWDAIPIGACFSFKNIYNNQTVASGIKLALSGLEGEKPILKSNGNLFTTLTKDAIYTVRWNGVNFILQGEGGEYGNVTPDDVIKGVTFGTEEGLKTGTLELTGNAAAADVLSGKTFYSTNPKSKLTGSMTNRGAVTHTLTTQGGSYTIPAGYHNGSGKVTANFANLVASNIKSGVNIGGVVGTYRPSEMILLKNRVVYGEYSSDKVTFGTFDLTGYTKITVLISGQSEVLRWWIGETAMPNISYPRLNSLSDIKTFTIPVGTGVTTISGYGGRTSGMYIFCMYAHN